jgi:cystathionine beta-lyase/cystathionine gamma-synthase
MKSEINKRLAEIIESMPQDWTRLTTHRLDIYNENLAKVEFLEKLNSLDPITKDNLASLPTAYDYIRLGHPLSCVLEWAWASQLGVNNESVICFSSQAMPILAILRKNKFLKKKTRIAYKDQLPANFDEQTLKEVYDYEFETIKVSDYNNLSDFTGSTIVIDGEGQGDFNVNLYPQMGSVIEVLNNDKEYIKEIQHVRRRESIAMTPQNCLAVIHKLIGDQMPPITSFYKSPLNETIKEITSASSDVAFGSSGLSVQYAIMMGLIDEALERHPGRDIQFIVPPNCYGGTNDQARRVAACVSNVEIVDLPVDSGKNMVQELEVILTNAAKKDIVPYIIAEIPTNPRVEIPDLEKLRLTLKEQRKTDAGKVATAPVFILDQTFCPNVKFFGDGGYLNDVNVVSYVSGSKFPSGGLCTAGYAVANAGAAPYMSYVEKHLKLCDNIATNLQLEILTKEMPSMNERIAKAYKNTRAFVDHIEKELPEAKINFVSHELAAASFTPSVFSLDLPSIDKTGKECEKYKNEINHKLIKMMIEAIPLESKHCVSYGQLKGCYWTIPATSTQGTTKECDKDYIVRISIGADFDLEKHKEVFTKFVQEEIK